MQSEWRKLHPVLRFSNLRRRTAAHRWGGAGYQGCPSEGRLGHHNFTDSQTCPVARHSEDRPRKTMACPTLPYCCFGGLETGVAVLQSRPVGDHLGRMHFGADGLHLPLRSQISSSRSWRPTATAARWRVCKVTLVLVGSSKRSSALRLGCMGKIGRGSCRG